MNNREANMVRTSCFFTKAQVAEINKAAKEDDRFPAQIIRRAVSDWLQRRAQERNQRQ